MGSVDLIIPDRFNGPDGSGNGGVAAGMLAAFVGETAVVRLHVPPPLETRLEVIEDDSVFSAYRKDEVVMTAKAASLQRHDSPTLSWGQVEAAEKRFRGSEFHASPNCFVCGPNRESDDGLRIFPGRVDGTDYVAATWIPHKEHGDQDGQVDPSVVWGALDCPGAWAAITAEISDESFYPALGEMTLAMDAPVWVDEPHIITARLINVDGRKLATEATLSSADGEVKARARHVEIILPVNWAPGG